MSDRICLHGCQKICEDYFECDQPNDKKVTFIGIHYKDGKEALDSSTLSGSRIDLVINKLNVECKKANLFATIRMPEGEDFNRYMCSFRDEGVFVLLGLKVRKHFPYQRYKYAKIIKAYHPAYPKSHTATNEYIEELLNQIINVLKN